MEIVVVVVVVVVDYNDAKNLTANYQGSKSYLSE